ncbi:TadE family type IV pilus minor pilin [Nocardioides sp.]|uniref:TadE family type IV pilus minor pilin n=1 Tax=Nocardioides sp. TaxID=35761 RepID=UPI003513AAAB
MTARSRRRPAPRGAVTAELALGLPLLLAVTAALVWLLAVGVAQVRTVDAAREVARAVARGDAESTALSAGRRVAPAGVVLTVNRADGRVSVTARGRMEGPGGLLSFAGVTLQAEAVAVLEETGQTAGPGAGPGARVAP